MIRVLITAIGGGGFGEQILKAIRLAGEGRYWILGADANPNCPQFAHANEHTVLPLATSPDYLERLLALIHKQKIQVIFPGCEPELKLIAKHRAEFEARGIFLPINTDPVIDICMNKEDTNRHLIELGFDSPKFAVVENRLHFADINWFPVVVKPSVGGGGSTNVFIAQNHRELVGLADYLNLEENQIKFFIQEYVGTPEEEYTVGILHDMDGNYINSIAVKRALTGQLNIRTSVQNRTGRKELGPRLIISSGVSQGQVGRHAVVTRQCKEIAGAIGARGPINIQCRLVGDVVKVFEINPRFSGTTSIRAMVGYNEPDVLMRRHLLGEKFAMDFAYDEAVIFRSLIETKIES